MTKGDDRPTKIIAEAPKTQRRLALVSRVSAIFGDAKLVAMAGVTNIPNARPVAVPKLANVPI